VAHDLDAGGLGGDGLLELVDHGLGRPGGKLLLELDPERLGGLRRAGLTRQGGTIAGIAAHLHVHGEAGTDQIISHGAGDALHKDGQDGSGQKGPSLFHHHFLPLLAFAPSLLLSTITVRARPIASDETAEGASTSP
jgi:hypothetical protein